MRFFVIVGLTVCLFKTSFATDIYAVASGNWDANTGSANNIWSTDKNAGAPTSGLRPISTDNVYTNGRSVTASANVSCRNLYISYATSPSLTINSLRTVTVNGTLTGWDDAGLADQTPQAGVIVFNSSSSSIIAFTGNNIDLTYTPYIIYGWDSTSPLGRTNFNLTGTKNILLDMSFSAKVTIQAGTLGLESTFAGSGTAGQTLQVDAGATLAAGSNSISGFPTLTISGNLTSSSALSGVTDLTVDGTLTTTGSITSSNATIGSAGTVSTSNFFNVSTNLTINGILVTSYTGGTQGWWSGSNSPSGTVSLGSTSTIEYGAGAAQVVAIRSYGGKLTLSGSGAKTAAGSGSLTVGGDLTIGSPFNSDASSGVSLGGILTNNSTWAPLDLVIFNGSGAQSVSGSSNTTFSGGLEVNKSAGTLSLNRTTTVDNGITIAAGTFNWGSQTVNLTNGDINNDGTLTAGTSTININGTTAVTGSASTTLNNVVIGSGKSFTANSGLTITGTLTNSGSFVCPSAANVNINGALVNNGTGSFTHNSGTITFAGSSTQNVSGAGTLSLNNITASNSVTNNGTIQLNGVFTLGGTASFDADGSGSGSFTVMSSSQSVGGSVAQLTSPGNFSGNVTIQRAINSTEDWRYLSYPIKNGGTVASWQDDFPVTGFSGESCTADGTIIVDCSAPSIYEYDAATQQYVAVSASTYAGAALSSRKGYSVYAYNTNSKNVDVSGQIEAGAIPISLSTSYNLIPNPYPSPIDWDLVDRTGTDNTVYMTTAQGSYASYVAGGGACTGCSFNTNWRGEIAIGQSFWINSSSATSLTFQEDDKVSSGTFVREGSDAVDYFRIILSSGAQLDDAIVSFRKKTSGDYDFGVDALKRKNGYFDSGTGMNSMINVSTFSTDPAADMAINAISPIQCNGSIKVKVADLPAGTHTLKFTELDNVTLGYKFTLKDNFTGTQTSLGNNAEYEFQVTSNAASVSATRFEILFSSPQIDISRDLKLSSSFDCTDPNVKLNIDNLQPGVQYLFKLNDQALHAPVTSESSTGPILVSKSLLGFGANKLSLTASSLDGCNAKIYNDILTVNFAQVNEIATVVGAKSCGSGQLTLSATGAALDGHYNWYDGLTVSSPISGQNTASFKTPVLDATKVYYVTAINANGCESSLRKPVEATVVKIPAPVMTFEGNTLQVDATSGIQWLKNGVVIEGETNSTYKVTATGTYSVRVTTDGCSGTSSAREFIINGIESKGQTFGFSAYPNPTSDYVVIHGPCKNIEQMQMFDSKGSTVALTPENMDVSEDKTVIDIRKNKQGLYILNLVMRDKIVQFKVLKK